MLIMSIRPNVSLEANISWLILCLDDLSRAVSGVFRSPTIIVFFPFPPVVLLVVALYILVLPV